MFPSFFNFWVLGQSTKEFDLRDAQFIPAIFITRAYGLVGFWVCMAVELTFRGSLFLIRLWRGTWLKKV